MSIEAYTLVHRWFDEVWNHGHEETIDGLLTSDALAHGLGEGADTRGPAGFKVFWRNMRTALPDINIRIEDTIVNGDKAVVRLALEGTHLGEGLGLPPSGRRVSLAGIVILRMAGGRIAEAWNSWDQLGLLQQIGAIPSQGQDHFLSARS